MKFENEGQADKSQEAGAVHPPVWFRVSGSKEFGIAPLLYLHGGPGLNSYSFEHSIGRTLERSLSIVYVDQRGCGRSPRPKDGNYQLSAMLDDIESVREAIGAAKISLLGHSFGGLLALEYAARHPERVEKLIVVNAAIDMPDAFAHWQRRLETEHQEAWAATINGPAGAAFLATESGGEACATAKARAALVMQTIARIGPPSFRKAQQFHTDAAAARLQTLDRESGLEMNGEIMQAYFSPGNEFLCSMFSEEAKLAMPVLVVGGRFDGAAPIQTLQELAVRIPGAQFEAFEESAHWPFIEEPAHFEEVVTRFLQQVPAIQHPAIATP